MFKLTLLAGIAALCSAPLLSYAKELWDAGNWTVPALVGVGAAGAVTAYLWRIIVLAERAADARRDDPKHHTGEEQ